MGLLACPGSGRDPRRLRFGQQADGASLYSIAGACDAAVLSAVFRHQLCVLWTETLFLPPDAVSPGLRCLVLIAAAAVGSWLADRLVLRLSVPTHLVVRTILYRLFRLSC